MKTDFKIFFKCQLLFATFFGLMIVFLLLFHFIFRWIPINEILPFAIDFSLAVCIFLGFTYLKTEDISETTQQSNLSYFFLFLGLATLWFVFSPIVALHKPVLNLSLEFTLDSFNKAYYKSNYLNIYGISRTLLLVPILEEVFYRRIILSNLLKKHKTIFSIIVSSLMFSIGHLDYNYSIVFLIFGILLGTFYWRTKNLYLTIIIHIVINVLTLFLTET